MPKQQEPEWQRFRIPALGGKSELTTISHVAHLETALRIVADGEIRAGLVFDRSRLNTKRILVTWLSPNDWTGAGGFRYGNVRFTFDWKSLIQNMRFFWVESIAYGIEACRILVTPNDYSGELEPYDPTHADGPWWHDTATGRHYWNGNFCLEIMIERSVGVTETMSVDFVDHHPRFCNINPSACSSRDLRRDPASALFVAALVGRGINSSALKLTHSESGVITPTTTLRNASLRLADVLLALEVRYKREVTPRHHVALPLARSVLDAFARSKNEDLVPLASLFDSKYSLVECCTKAMAQHFQITDWYSIYPFDF